MSRITPAQMTWIDAVRTLRKEQDLPFEQACIKATEFFVKKDWPIPAWAEKWRPR